MVHAVPAYAANHALYVGVAQYQFGRPNFTRGSFSSLEGAPNDIDQIKRALEARYRFATREVLLDGRATRAQILERLSDFASGKRGVAGDTLLFYFTGHGARLMDLDGSQAGRFHSTILPFDARDPSRAASGEFGDIVDVELKSRIDAIARRGINVVTLFDSCNSGTATRSIPFRKWRSKAAPQIRGHVPPTPSVFATASAATPGYVVHLAAAADNSEAIENLVDGKYRSDFTIALSKAILRAAPGASYQEIFNAAQLQLVQAGLGQDPRAEGALLTPFMGETRVRERVLEAAPLSNDTYSIPAGKVAGVGPGAKFAFFPSIQAALNARAMPLASARVESADDWQATLNVEGKGQRLFARQLSPSFETERLRIRLGGGARASNSLARKLAAYDVIQISDDNPAYEIDASAGRIKIVNAFGETVKALDESDEAGLATFLEGLARYHALLGIAEKGEAMPVALEFTSTDCNGGDETPVRTSDGRPIFRSGDRFHLRLRNDDRQPLYFYLLALSADYSIELLDPPASGPGKTNDTPIAAQRLCYEPLASADARMSDPGTHHLMLIAAEKPIQSLHMLQQEALRGTTFTDPLERLLASAASGLRSPVLTTTPARWGAKVITYVVRPKR